ncbi:MAG TPA: helix-turn-helix domain-containing protein [Solirubrobacterales bacterium]|nr:helix-turn-helix domain-containing protein [Solirubrobacterales bacterium]
MADAAGARKRARPGGHELRPEVVAHHQRQRILAGAAAVFAERGYRQVTVADIVKSAAVARARFYENFASKEACFFALYDSATEAALAATESGCEDQQGEFPDRVGAGLEALLANLEADPGLARSWIVEGPAVGAAIDERFERLIGDFAALLRRGRAGAGATELPDSVEETVVGGLYWLLYYALLEGRPKRIGKLLPQLTEFALIPFAGTETARNAAASS